MNPKKGTTVELLGAFQGLSLHAWVRESTGFTCQSQPSGPQFDPKPSRGVRLGGRVYHALKRRMPHMSPRSESITSRNTVLQAVMSALDAELRLILDWPEATNPKS